MENEVNKSVLFEHFAGRSTPLQKKRIEAWLASFENQEVYYEVMDAWENEFSQVETDMDKALSKSLQGINNERVILNIDAENIQISFLHKNKLWLRNIAAILLISGTSLFLFKNEILFKTYQTAFGELRTIELSDKTLVDLNSNTILKVPRFGFGDGNRVVELFGEANFKVTHTENNKRFIVKTQKHFDVEVYGTEFDVYARNSDAKIVLTKGKVTINIEKGEANQKIEMKPGELVTIDNIGKVNLKQVAEPQNIIAWKEHKFIFEQNTLSQIATMINDSFGTTIEFENKTLAEKTLTGSFKAKTVDELLMAISELLDINYKQKNDHVIFFE
jgi:transmembrane sensor